MSALEPWFHRKFAFDLPNARLTTILERLRGSPARLEERVSPLPAPTLQARLEDKWSIQENVGHPCDPEPLWIRRAEQVLAGEAELAVADLTNRPTDEAHHNDAALDHILKHFRALRLRFVSILEGAPGSVLERSARHPRLGTPMRLIDIAFFTAEHDDHHLARITELISLAAARK